MQIVCVQKISSPLFIIVPFHEKRISIYICTHNKLPLHTYYPQNKTKKKKERKKKEMSQLANLKSSASLTRNSDGHFSWFLSSISIAIHTLNLILRGTPTIPNTRIRYRLPACGTRGMGKQPYVNTSNMKPMFAFWQYPYFLPICELPQAYYAVS